MQPALERTHRNFYVTRSCHIAANFPVRCRLVGSSRLDIELSEPRSLFATCLTVDRSMSLNLMLHVFVFNASKYNCLQINLSTEVVQSQTTYAWTISVLDATK